MLAQFLQSTATSGQGNSRKNWPNVAGAYTTASSRPSPPQRKHLELIDAIRPGSHSRDGGLDVGAAGIEPATARL